MVGLPYPNKGSPELIEKMKYIDARHITAGSGKDVGFGFLFKRVFKSLPIGTIR